MNKVKRELGTCDCGRRIDRISNESRCEQCMTRHYVHYFHKDISMPRITAVRTALTSLLIECLVLMIATSAEAKTIKGEASFYGEESCKFNPQREFCPTASGKSLYTLLQKEIKEDIHFAAAWDIPFGTRIKVVNLRTGKSTIATIWDRGPSRRFHNRIVDLSKKSFEEIAEAKEGLIPVEVSYDSIQ